jgi:hypothetical protein
MVLTVSRNQSYKSILQVNAFQIDNVTFAHPSRKSVAAAALAILLARQAQLREVAFSDLMVQVQSKQIKYI